MTLPRMNEEVGGVGRGRGAAKSAEARAVRLAGGAARRRVYMI
jgi:hypothetical protein